MRRMAYNKYTCKDIFRFNSLQSIIAPPDPHAPRHIQSPSPEAQLLCMARVNRIQGISCNNQDADKRQTNTAKEVGRLLPTEHIVTQQKTCKLQSSRHLIFTRRMQAITHHYQSAYRTVATSLARWLDASCKHDAWRYSRCLQGAQGWYNFQEDWIWVRALHRLGCIKCILPAM